MRIDEPKPVLNYQVPKLKPARWPGIVIASLLDTLSSLIGLFLIDTIVEAFTYKGAENYAKIVLVIVAPLGLLLQAVLGTIALGVAVRRREHRWPRLVSIVVVAVAIVAPASVVLTFMIFARR